MALYEWTDRLSVGDEAIDKQHRVLIGYINSLAEAIEQENNISTLLGMLLSKLVVYTKAHFIYEEMLFHANDYPDLEEHKKYHQLLTQQVDEFYTRFKAGDVNLGFELLDFLMNWLNKHILGSDLAYVEFAHQHANEQYIQRQKSGI
jgi:hemerythrin